MFRIWKFRSLQINRGGVTGRKALCSSSTPSTSSTHSSDPRVPITQASTISSGPKPDQHSSRGSHAIQSGAEPSGNRFNTTTSIGIATLVIGLLSFWILMKSHRNQEEDRIKAKEAKYNADYDALRKQFLPIREHFENGGARISYMILAVDIAKWLDANSQGKLKAENREMRDKLEHFRIASRSFLMTFNDSDAELLKQYFENVGYANFWNILLLSIALDAVNWKHMHPDTLGKYPVDSWIHLLTLVLNDRTKLPLLSHIPDHYDAFPEREVEMMHQILKNAGSHELKAIRDMLVKR